MIADIVPFISNTAALFQLPRFGYFHQEIEIPCNYGSRERTSEKSGGILKLLYTFNPLKCYRIFC